jgi:coenzyme F420-reducing hydrogenase alpha subunit
MIPEGIVYSLLKNRVRVYDPKRSCSALIHGPGGGNITRNVSLQRVPPVLPRVCGIHILENIHQATTHLKLIEIVQPISIPHA